MPPKKKKDLLTPRVKTRKATSITSKSNITAVSPAKSPVLDPQEILDLESTVLELKDTNPLNNNGDVVVTNSPKELERSVNVSEDSNGPVQTVHRVPETILRQEVGQVLTEKPNSPNEQAKEPSLKSVTLARAVETTDDMNDLALSDEEGTELIESKIEENICHQTERLFDIIENLDLLNKKRWSDCKILSTGIDKLKFLKERANRAKAQSIDLPEFLERRPMKDQPEYAFVRRILKAWDQIKQKMEIAKGHIYELPISQMNENAPKKPSSSSSIVSGLKEENNKKGQVLDQKLKELTSKTEMAKANVEKIYGNKKGKAINDILKRAQPSFVDPSPYQGSIDGDLQIKDLPIGSKAPNQGNLQQNHTQKPRILPRGIKLEDYLDDHPSIQETVVPRNRNFNIKPKEPRPNVKIARPGQPLVLEQGDGIVPEDSVSQYSQRPTQITRMSHRPRVPQRSFFDQQSSKFPRHGVRTPLEDNWVCVPTDKHPETDKPLHKGRIRSFSNLFRNTFQLNVLFDPNSRGQAKQSYSDIAMIKFTGNNVEVFREYEQSVLMKIINDDSLDFDGKFHKLLGSTSGSPLAVVQAYTDELDLANFVQAIEALYYAYGEPTKFRDSLVRQLINDDPIDIKKPGTLVKTNALISRIFRAFGGEDAGNTVLSMSVIMNSVKMTPETATNFQTWLSAAMKEKNLKVLQQWLQWIYTQNVEEVLSQRASQGFQAGKRQPVLTNTMEPSKEVQETLVAQKSNPLKDGDLGEVVLLNAGKAKMMENRCPLCFNDSHRFADCRIYMYMTGDERKLTLMIREGCFCCTGIGHLASKCESRINCQKCQSPSHHESICEASSDSWMAAKNHKWEKPQATKKNPVAPPRRNQTETKKSFLVQGEDLSQD